MFRRRLFCKRLTNVQRERKRPVFAGLLLFGADRIARQIWHGRRCCAIEKRAPRPRRSPDSMLASHSSAGDFFMRRSVILAGVAVDHAGCTSCRRPCAAADAAGAGRHPRMPRRRERRLHRRLGDQSRLRTARRRHAGGPLCRDHPQGRPRYRHHPGIGAGLGRVCAGGAARTWRSLRQLCRRAGQRFDRRRSRRQRAGRRFGEFDRAAAAQRAGPGRPQPRGLAWRAWNFGREGKAVIRVHADTLRFHWSGSAVHVPDDASHRRETPHRVPDTHYPAATFFRLAKTST